LKGLISENKDGKTALNFAHRSVELLFDSWPLSREHKSHEEYDAYRKLVKTKVEFLGDFYRFINGLDASYSLDVTVGDLALEMVLLRGDGRDETSFKKHLHRIVTKDPLLKSCNPRSVKLVRSILSRPRGERLSYVSDQEPPPLGSDVEADLTVLDTIYRYKTGSGDILSNLKLFGNGFRKAVELNPSLTTALAGALEEVRDRVKKDTILRIDSSLGLPLETPSVKPITVDPTIKEASELYRMIDDLVKAKDHKRLNTVVRDLARTVSESGDLKPYMDIFDTFYLASQAEGLIGRGQYNVAVGMADLVIRFEPSNPQAHYVVGKVNYRLGRDQHKKGKIDTARKYFDKATKEYLSALVYDKTETALLELKEALENLS
ncbi:hypothetical protein J4216_03950, partial [Candidatus Woesearchaeota archaeon]|nr:hypothetical protein [Candidatus Woesearchaeota archaeon]